MSGAALSWFDVCRSLANHCAPTQSHIQYDKGHGQIEKRTVQTYAPLPDCIPEGWPDISQVIQVSGTVERKQRTDDL